MIRGVAFCPIAPVLIPELAQDAAPELDELRAACRQAIRQADGPGRQWVLVGPATTTAQFGPAAKGTLAGFGISFETGLAAEHGGEPVLPPSLTVGAWLLRDALGSRDDVTAWSVGDSFDPVLLEWDTHARGDADHALLVLGDGSARRSLKAPGYLDERATAFDGRVAAALAAGEGGRLHFPDGDEGLLASGPAVWDLVSRSLGTCTWDATLLYDQAPYGVGYFVAVWARD